MHDIAVKYPLATKCLRIALVFTLVFGTSFGIETLAFAAGSTTLNTDDVIVELAVYEAPEAPTTDDGSSTGEQPGTGTQPGTSDGASTEAGGTGAGTGDATGTPTPEPDPISSTLGSLVRDTNDEANMASQFYVPEINEQGASKSFVAVLTVRNAEGQTREIDATPYVVWSLEETELATLSGSGTLSAVVNQPDGEVALTCALNDAYLSQLEADYFTTHPTMQSFAVNFKASITGQVSPYVQSIEILSQDGTSLTSTDSGRALELAEDQEGYTFQARVEVMDPTSGLTSTYYSTPEQGLEQQTNGVIPNLVWQLDEARAASIDSTGALSMATDTQVVVRCSTTTAAPDAEPATDVVSVMRPVKLEPYVSGVEILQTDGSAVGEGKSMEIPVEGSATYQLGARVTLTDPNDDSTHTYTLVNGVWQTDSALGTDTLPFQLSWNVTVSEDAEAQAVIDSNGLLTLNSGDTTIVMLSASPGQNGGTADDTLTINPAPAEPEEDDEQGQLRVVISYVPVPEGQVAVLSSYPVGVHGFTYINSWEESQDGGATWTAVDNGYEHILQIPTAEPYIGRMYRACVEVVAVEKAPEELIGTRTYSEPVTIEIGTGVNIALFVKYVPEGETALFTTDIRGTVESPESLTYVWEESSDEGKTWQEMASGYLPSYSIVTERPRFGHQFRVSIKESPEGEVIATSNVQMLAANAPAEPSDGSDPDDPNAPAADEPGTGTDTKTLSEEIEEQGEVRVNFDDKPATMKAVDKVEVAETTQQEPTPKPETKPETTPQGQQSKKTERPTLNIDAKATGEIAEQKEAAQQKINDSEPGARWNPIYPLNEPEEITRSLDSNPFNRLVGPMGLGVLAAGFIEKRVRFREEKRSA